ncbi:MULTISPECIES: ATP-dependent nuclease [unclassified Sphingobium]|uniref:ATP-dependent nuclease n=1 Tax=unclassified Sphingobium TaxID=2611147 RepID=UPI002224D84D|nr:MULTISPECIES: AAA family ATPase [unclassified Sphingobium]MCW2412993.1 AAA15 family ATPase/GTPase [Sphingobium sp. B8D3D]MCW2414707.1 AAA15 family ATPase/GTPase [Sphingobium sp. B8D3A]
MRIIDKIEIYYFRSVYSVSLAKCKDVNVLVGSNDAGKSNIIKSLNLFFNNETEPHSEFDFFRDLSRSREEEARAAKGRMSVWIKVHFNNFLRWKSLPEQFWVKRSWNRYESRPTDSFSDEIAPTTLYRFLNKIRFHYIPAVRGRDIFADLLADLHDTLLQDESLGLKGSSQALVSDLHKITREMSDSIKSRLKIDSTIEIPESLKDLFRALDFSTKYGRFSIPLNLRGDGIQSRHLPFILDYIASKSSTYHIWGYEEPENSLELSRSFEMSRDFVENFSRDNQIFLTTHSPAFYDISSSNASKWYVENKDDPEQDYSYTDVTPINSTSDIDKSMGLLTVIAPRMRAANQELLELRSDIRRMSEEMSANNKPAIYVEGETDAIILRRAAEVFGYDADGLSFFSADGASNITQFIKVMSRTKSDQRVLVGLFDGDSTGRSEFDRFNAYHMFAGTDMRVVSRPNRIYVGALNVPLHLKGMAEQFSQLKLQLPLCIEYMFRGETIARAQQEGVLVLEKRRSKLSLNELPLEINVEDAFRGKIPDDYIYFARKVSDQRKMSFAQWIVKEADDEFEVFEDLMNNLGKILQK